MKTEFEDFMGNFAGSKKQVRKIMANNPLKQQLAMQKRTLQAARMRQKIQAKQIKQQQIEESMQPDPSLDPNYDPTLDPNYDPSLDPNYDPNAIPMVQTNLLTTNSPQPNYYLNAYGDPIMNPNFFAKGGKKSGGKSKTTTITTKTGLGGKAVKGIIEEFNKNAAQIYANQAEMKKIDNEMAKTQDQADMQRTQLESTMSIAQSAIDAASAAGQSRGDSALTDYLISDGAQPSYVPAEIGDDVNSLLEDDNYMEYDEYLGDNEDYNEYDDDNDFDESEDYDEYADDSDFDEGEDYDEYADDSDYDEYDDDSDYDEFLGAAKKRKHAGGGAGGGMRKANRQAKKAARQTNRQAKRANRLDLKQQRQLNRKQKLLMKAGHKKNVQTQKLLKRQQQLMGKHKKVASRREKLRKIMQVDPNIRSAVMRGESSCSLFNKLNACALPPSLWRWRDCGRSLAPRQKMVNDKFNQLTYGEYDDNGGYDEGDDNVFDCSCQDCSCQES